jgi:hypothetical protein
MTPKTANKPRYVYFGMSRQKPLRRYSGSRSTEFWKRVNSLPRNHGGETAYCLGVALQNLEEHVLRYLENAEARYRPDRRRAA